MKTLSTTWFLGARNRLCHAKTQYGAVHDIPQEEACKMFWELLDGDHVESLADDLVFFVPDDPKQTIQVCRHAANSRPSITVKVDWVATLALNFISHMRYRLRISTCSYYASGDGEMSHLTVDEEAVKQVFASPVEEMIDGRQYSDMDGCCATSQSPRFSYPQMYFSIHDYDTCFQDITIAPESIFIVELVACFDDGKEASGGKGHFYRKIEANADTRTVFQGAVTYEALVAAHQCNSASQLDLLGGGQRAGFVLMNGPDGYGEAQVHASLPQDKRRSSVSVLGRIKDFVRSSLADMTTDSGVASQTTAGNGRVECRLTFIRMHWLEVINALLS